MNLEMGLYHQTSSIEHIHEHTFINTHINVCTRTGNPERTIHQLRSIFAGSMLPRRARSCSPRRVPADGSVSTPADGRASTPADGSAATPARLAIRASILAELDRIFSAVLELSADISAAEDQICGVCGQMLGPGGRGICHSCWRRLIGRPDGSDNDRVGARARRRAGEARAGTAALRRSGNGEGS